MRPNRDRDQDTLDAVEGILLGLGLCFILYLLVVLIFIW